MIRTGKEFVAAVKANEEHLVFEVVANEAAAKKLMAEVGEAPAGYRWRVTNRTRAWEMGETWIVVLENVAAAEREERANELNGR